MEISERFGKLFGAAVGIDEPHQRAAERTCGVRHDHGLRTVGQTGQPGAGLAAAQGFENTLDGGETADSAEKLCHDGENHCEVCRMRSRSAEVE